MAYRLSSIALVAFLTLFWPLSGQAGEYLVANVAPGDGVISRDDVRSMYLNQKPKWPSGQRVKLAMLAHGKERDDFLRQFVGKNSARFERYWKRQLFTGKGVPPQTFVRQSALLDYIRRTPGAIGFVEAEVAPTGVFILELNEKKQPAK